MAPDARAGAADLLRLTPALKAELTWLAGEAPLHVARHARIVLARARGNSIGAVAAAVGVHPNTVRNCLRRFEDHGLRGLGHASAGRPKNAAFTDAVRDEIARVAMHSPARGGEPYTHWSLRRLRTHLLRRGLIQEISVEGLRHLLGGLPLPPAYWQRAARPLGRLAPELRRAIESLARDPRRDRSLRAQIVLASHQGLNEAEVAAALHLGRETVRRWLRRFRRNGILGLQTHLPHATVARTTREAVLRVATSDPRRYGVNRSHWSLPTLHAALIRHGVVRAISQEHLRGILAEASARLRTGPAAA
jgi:transposase